MKNHEVQASLKGINWFLYYLENGGKISDVTFIDLNAKAEIKLGEDNKVVHVGIKLNVINMDSGVVERVIDVCQGNNEEYSKFYKKRMMIQKLRRNSV